MVADGEYEYWGVGHCVGESKWAAGGEFTLAQHRLSVFESLLEEYPCLNTPEASIWITADFEDNGYEVYAEGWCFEQSCIVTYLAGDKNDDDSV